MMNYQTKPNQTKPLSGGACLCSCPPQKQPFFMVSKPTKDRIGLFELDSFKFFSWFQVWINRCSLSLTCVRERETGK